MSPYDLLFCVYCCALNSYYGTDDGCDEQSGLYGWYGVDKCIPSDGTSIMINYCKDSSYEVAVYNDETCTDFGGSNVIPFGGCEPSNDDTVDDEVTPSKSYESYSCTN